MRFRDIIRQRFIIFFFIFCVLSSCVSVVSNPEYPQERKLISCESEKCSHEPTWKKEEQGFGIIERNVFLDFSNFKSIQNSVYFNRNCPNTNVPSKQEDNAMLNPRNECNQWPLLKNKFPSLCFMIILLLVINTSLEAACQVNSTSETKRVDKLKKWLESYFNSLLGYFDPLLIVNPLAKKEKYRDLKCKKMKKYEWMHEPMNKLVYFKEYVVHSVFERIASFSQLASPNQPTSYVTLAQAGFRYVGRETVECHECRMIVEIRKFDSTAVAPKFHKEGCSYISVENNRSTFNYLQDIPEVGATSNEDHVNEDICTDSVGEVARTAENNEKIAIEIVPENRKQGNLFLGSQANSSTNENNQFLIECSQSRNECNSQPPVIVSHPLGPASDSSPCPETVAGFSPHHPPCGGGDHGLAAPLQPPASLPPEPSTPNQSNLQNEGTSEATIPKQQETSSAADPELVGATAAFNVLDDAASNDVFNATLYDMVEFSPEHEQCTTTDQDLLNNCQKNPGHFTNIPIKQLHLDHIPSNVRCPNVLKFVSLVASVTVKLEIQTTSKMRPPSSECIEGAKRFGTGMAIRSDLAPNSQKSSKWSTMKKYFKSGKNKFYIYIHTTRHVIYDDCEAQQTVVEFTSYNGNQKKSVLGKGVSVEHSHTLGDFTTILKCKVNDSSLLDFVTNTQKEISNLARSFPLNIKQELMKRVFVISHPHGGDKVLSYGEHVMVKYAQRKETQNDETMIQLTKINNHTQISQNPNEIRKVLLYTADTCKGSSGAPVIFFIKKKINNNAEDIVFDLWIHGGVSTKSGLNAAIMKELTADDIANHGITEIFRPAAQVELEAAADRAANQVVSCPIFIVNRPPVHPAYANGIKRLESYPNQFTHVHTAEDLSDAGFFYAGYDDCVRCFQCGLGLKSWKQGDIIHQEHHRNRPECQFLQLKLKASGINPVSFSSLDRRSWIQSSAEPQPTQTSGNEIGQQEPSSLATGTNGSTASCSEDLLRNVCQECMIQPKSLQIVPNHQQVIVAPATGTYTNNGPTNDDNVLINALEKEHQYLKQLLTCKVCQNNPVKDLFLPCGELVACLECSKLLTHCPSCNKKILATVTTYFS